MDQQLALLDEELEAQAIELLPSRETLFLDFNIANVIAVNLSLAVNAASIGSVAKSFAGQAIIVMQH
jgi:hypothetical protein